MIENIVVLFSYLMHCAAVTVTAVDELSAAIHSR